MNESCKSRPAAHVDSVSANNADETKATRKMQLEIKTPITTSDEAPQSGLSANLKVIMRRKAIPLSLLVAVVAPLSATANPPISTKSDRAPEMRLAGKTVTLPLVMVREFPFIEGEIAGVRGKFMLDTGMQDALVINDHRVPLVGGSKIGTGHFGSGQTYDVRLHSEVRKIRIGDIDYARVTSVRSQDARMLEKITPDFLGWIGYGFFSSHAMKLDYQHLEVTFYEEGPDRFLGGEKLVAALPFETRKLPNIPLMRARIGDVDAIISLDTGMYGSLNIGEEKRRRLLDGGQLSRTEGSDTFDLTGVRIADKIDISAPGIEVEEGASASAAPVGITEDTELELGFVFLRNFKTVWDYREKQLYVLAQ